MSTYAVSTLYKYRPVKSSFCLWRISMQQIVADFLLIKIGLVQSIPFYCLFFNLIKNVWSVFSASHSTVLFFCSVKVKYRNKTYHIYSRGIVEKSTHEPLYLISFGNCLSGCSFFGFITKLSWCRMQIMYYKGGRDLRNIHPSLSPFPSWPWVRGRGNPKQFPSKFQSLPK